MLAECDWVAWSITRRSDLSIANGSTGSYGSNVESSRPSASASILVDWCSNLGSLSVNSTHTPSFRGQDISLGFPHFDGTTPALEWIFKVEKLFTYHHTPDIDRVDIATIHFEKEVIPWFQMLQKLNVVSTWIALTSALESQFGPFVWLSHGPIV